MTSYEVGAVSELEEGDRVVVEIEGKEVAVFHLDGEYYAYLNWCLHQGGPCCEGPVSGTYSAWYDRENRETVLSWDREDEILNCPWHGWEYEIKTGDCLARQGLSLPSYPVSVEDGMVYVEL